MIVYCDDTSYTMEADTMEDLKDEYRQSLAMKTEFANMMGCLLISLMNMMGWAIYWLYQWYLSYYQHEILIYNPTIFSINFLSLRS